MLQAVVPREDVASFENDGEQSEEESDPTESSEEVPQLCEENSTIAGRPQVVVERRLFSVAVVKSCRGIVRQELQSDLQGRNGMGGPLRC